MSYISSFVCVAPYKGVILLLLDVVKHLNNKKTPQIKV